MNDFENNFGQTCKNGDLVSVASGKTQYLALVTEAFIRSIRVVFVSSGNVNNIGMKKHLYISRIDNYSWIKVSEEMLDSDQKKQYEIIRNYIKTIE